MSRNPSPCRILKDEVVANLFPIIAGMGFVRDAHPLRWFGWDISTRRYIWEFRRAPDQQKWDLLSIDLVCDRLMIQIDFARIENTPQHNVAGTKSPAEELSATGVPWSIRKHLKRRRRVFGLLGGSYAMRARKSDPQITQQRAKALVTELCADMKYIESYFEGRDTDGRVGNY